MIWSTVLLSLISVGLLAGQSVSLSCENLNAQIIELVKESVFNQFSSASIVSLNVVGRKHFDISLCETANVVFPKSIELNELLVLKVDLYDEDKAFTRRRTLFYDVFGMADIFVSNKKMSRGDVLTESSYVKTTIQMSELTPTMAGVLPSSNTYLVSSYIANNQPIESWMITRKLDVMKGHEMQASYKKDGILLTLPAILMENGNIGDIVKLKLKNNDKLVEGKVINNETISITAI